MVASHICCTLTLVLLWHHTSQRTIGRRYEPEFPGGAVEVHPYTLLLSATARLQMSLGGVARGKLGRIDAPIRCRYCTSRLPQQHGLEDFVGSTINDVSEN